MDTAIFTAVFGALSSMGVAVWLFIRSELKARDQKLDSQGEKILNLTAKVAVLETKDDLSNKLTNVIEKMDKKLDVILETKVEKRLKKRTTTTTT